MRGTYDEKAGTFSGACSVPLTSIKVDNGDTKTEHFQQRATNRKMEATACLFEGRLSNVKIGKLVANTPVKFSTEVPFTICSRPRADGGKEKVYGSAILFPPGSYGEAQTIRVRATIERFASDSGHGQESGVRMEWERPVAGASHQPVALLAVMLALANCGQPPDSPVVLIPAGEFTMGCDSSTDSNCSLSYTRDEGPARQVTLSAFEMDAHEVTAANYLECMRSGACEYFSPESPFCGLTMAGASATPAMGRGAAPASCVTWHQAADYCQWVGRRLPTEIEWERAARGTNGATFPWGNTAPECGQLVFAGSGCPAERPEEVGALPRGVSISGTHDMAGNVAEWTADFLGDAAAGVHVVRGGSWRDGPAADAGMPRSSVLPLRTSFRDSLIAVDQKTARSDWIGFRCARSL